MSDTIVQRAVKRDTSGLAQQIPARSGGNELAEKAGGCSITVKFAKNGVFFFLYGTSSASAAQTPVEYWLNGDGNYLSGRPAMVLSKCH